MIKKIAVILGTRPEIIKLSPVIRQLIEKNIDFFILHTNQHYTKNMDRVFFNELELPTPKYNLEIKETSNGVMTGKMLIGIEKILLKEKPNWVLVEGDTNTVLAGALASSHLRIKLGHVEAGLRSYDRTMPEEINRIVADHLSNILFCPTKKQVSILKREGIDETKIYLTGNTIVDAVYQNLKLAIKKYSNNKYQNLKYFLLTLHRPSNVDNKNTLSQLIEALESVSDKYNTPIYFPIHPRTKNRISQFKINIDDNKIKIISPVGYLKMLMLEKNAQLILTDSGGIQEEACVLKVPCVTLRKNTERPETLEVGSNILAGSDKNRILVGLEKMLKTQKNWLNPFGDGHAAEKIIKIVTLSW